MSITLVSCKLSFDSMGRWVLIMGWLQLEVVTMALLEAGRAWLNPSPKQLHCHRGLAQLSAVQL